MGRKKLSVKSEDKKQSLRKKLETKAKDVFKLHELFDPEKPIYYSDSLLTNNDDVMLFSIDDQFLIDNKIEHMVEPFNLNENDLELQFNKTKILDPILEEDGYLFESIGKITIGQFEWFSRFFPNCTFHAIDKWFGKKVNTLVIVLAEAHGKPVGILKTTE